MARDQSEIAVTEINIPLQKFISKFIFDNSLYSFKDGYEEQCHADVTMSTWQRKDIINHDSCSNNSCSQRNSFAYFPKNMNQFQDENDNTTNKVSRSSCNLGLFSSDKSKFGSNICWTKKVTLVLYPRLDPQYAKILPKPTFTIVRKYLLQRTSSNQWIIKVEAANVGSFPRSVC